MNERYSKIIFTDVGHNNINIALKLDNDRKLDKSFTPDAFAIRMLAQCKHLSETANDWFVDPEDSHEAASITIREEREQLRFEVEFDEPYSGDRSNSLPSQMAMYAGLWLSDVLQAIRDAREGSVTIH